MRKIFNVYLFAFANASLESKNSKKFKSLKILPKKLQKPQSLYKLYDCFL